MIGRKAQMRWLILQQPCWGASESLLGEFLESDRDHFVVVTKYTLFPEKATSARAAITARMARAL